MGNRRMGLGRLEALLEAVDRDLNLVNTTLTALKGISGELAATVTAAGTAAALTEALICPVDSANDAHKVKMFSATAAGQICIVMNIDSAQDAVVRNGADDATLTTLGEGIGCILASSATGDNWYVVAKGAV